MAATTDTLRKQHDSQPLSTEPAPYTPWREQSVTVKVLSILVFLGVLGLMVAIILILASAIGQVPASELPIILPSGGF